MIPNDTSTRHASPGGYGPPGGGGYGPPGGGGYGPPPGGGGGGYGAPPGGGGGGGGQNPPGWGQPPPGPGVGYQVYPPPQYGPPVGFAPMVHVPQPEPGNPTLRIFAIVLLVLGPLGVGAGLIPCLGWVNWAAVPINIAGLVLGIVGLTRKDKKPDGTTPDGGLYLAAIIVCALCMVVGTIRCILGAGVL
ncbi:MAG: hypothetical protein U0414_02780 [Polyangiaceae bacterium]